MLNEINKTKVNVEQKLDWDLEISSGKKGAYINFDEIYRYRDLLSLLVRRDLVSIYKQTILGPLWLLIQPLFTSIIQLVVFGEIAQLPSDGVPYFLFAFSGNILWSYFATSFNGVSETFKANEGLFGKVYFPRAIMPLVVTISNLIKFGFQFLLLSLIMVFFAVNGYQLNTNYFILATPVILLLMALISMGMGMIITSMTTKYRDFTFLMNFGVTLFMYVTPVVYPTSLFVERLPGSINWLLYINPLTGIFDLFRFAYFGSGHVNYISLVWSFFFAVGIYLFGLLVFNKTERTFMDTI